MSATVRVLKMGSVIQRALSSIFLVMGVTNVTVSQVKVSSDLGYAKVYICTVMDENIEETLLLIKEQRVSIMKKLRSKVAFKVPYLDFRRDASQGNYDNIDRLLKHSLDETN